MSDRSVLTPEFRNSFPAVHKPRRSDLTKTDEYSTTALFAPGENLSKMERAAQAAGEAKWGPDPTKWPRNVRSPFRDQGERARDGVLPQGYIAGAKFCVFRSNQKPGVVDQRVRPITDEREFYAGCYAHARVVAFAYQHAGNAGISFALVNLQKTRDGAPLGSRTRPEDDFTPIDDEGNTGNTPPAGSTPADFFS